MHVRFISQPFEDGFDLRDFLESVLSNDAVTSLDIAVAWVKRSGLRLIAQSIRTFQDRGGHVRMVVGISEGGATQQGLELALAHADEVFIYHSVSGRTFHPKVYAAYGSDIAQVLVGSHNLTYGGMVHNFEAGIVYELDLESPEDQQFLKSIVNGFIERLIDDAEVCVRLDEDVLRTIANNPAYQVGDENVRRGDLGTPTTSEALESDSDSVTTDPANAEELMFGKSKFTLRAAPRSFQNQVTADTNLPTDPDNHSLPSANDDKVIQRRWYKKLDAGNAQRPDLSNRKRSKRTDTKTNVTGHLTLTKNRFPIEIGTYFRNDLFRSALWTQQEDGTGEHATITFDVLIHGEILGTFNLEVTHTPTFESGQHNRSTVLHWGNDLGSVLKNSNFVGDIVTIETFLDDSFRITIASEPAGPFLA